ncbi:MAG TPA: hypothetical protein VES42_07085 [Pilimelia sp.]|nr:hypothetical protein [Pilimelia sp.]
MHAVVLLVALVALLLLPCVVATVIFADEVALAAGRAIRRRRAARRARRVLGDLDHTLDAALTHQQAELAELGGDARPPIEQVAADLRRLGGLRLGVAVTSQVWHAAILRAYDDELRAACRSLRVPEHLGELAGVDLEIERLRVEGELLARGLELRPTRWGQAA